MKKPVVLLAAFLTLCLASCDSYDTQIVQGESSKVEVISAGQVVRTYDSVGEVLCLSQCAYFMDAATHKKVAIYGDVIISD
jgi:hypothetical protein